MMRASQDAQHDMHRRVAFYAALSLCLAMVSAVRAENRIVLVDVTKETGITFKHTDGSDGRKFIFETVSAGLALFDYDGDGDEDIYFLNGAPEHLSDEEAAPRNRLYRNDGNWKFTDVTTKAGVGDTGYGLGVAVADYDNDGDLDLYLNNFGPNVFYRNNGDGTFSDVTTETGTGNGDQMGAGVSFLDMDGDGDLDLYVCNYVEADRDSHVPTTIRGILVHAGPGLFPPTPDKLYRNNGDHTFTDVSSEAGIAQFIGAGMGVISTDYDGDGDADIYVANDQGENRLFRNNGGGRFDEQAMLAGLGFNQFGHIAGSMGVDAGDYDNDGLIDILVTAFETATLYRNLGKGVFDDVTGASGAGRSGALRVTWGGGFADFDNDGKRDIFMAAGHTLDNIELVDDRFTFKQPNLLLQNTGGKFVNVSSRSGDGLKVRQASKGIAFADLDSDGDLDVVILNTRAGPTLLRNDSVPPGHWLQVKLKGVTTNRYGVGARVQITAGIETFVDEVHSGRGYQSHYGLKLHFGLGTHQQIDHIQVRWIGGDLERFDGMPTDQVVTLIEGQGRRIEQASARSGTDSDLPETIPTTAPPPRELWTNTIGMQFVRIEAGEFAMGSPESEIGREPRERQHQVRLTRPFMLGIHEVTRGQFAAFVDASGYQTDAERGGWAFVWRDDKWLPTQGASWRKPGFEQADDHPVVCVTWNDARAFCDWLTDSEPAKRYRLPTEAEWEYASRAGTRTRFSFGESEDELYKYANYCERSNTDRLMWQDRHHDDSFDKTAPVGSLRPNPWGLYDMHGNVWEWCADWYVKVYPAAPATDPKGPAQGQFRALRGGAWFDRPWGCRAAYHESGNPNQLHDSVVGFRVALDIAE